MVLAVRDEHDRVEQLIALTQRLTKLLEQETGCFQARRPQDALAFAEEKMQLATLYRLESQKVRQNPELVMAAPAPLRERLRLVTIDFEEALMRNGAAIEATRTVTEGLVRAIGEEVTRNRTLMSGYGANGQIRADNAGLGIAADRRA